MPIKCYCPVSIPPNSASCLQQLDAGNIHGFKLHFKKQLLTHVMAHIDSCSVIVLNAVTWIDKAQKVVNPVFYILTVYLLNSCNYFTF